MSENVMLTKKSSKTISKIICIVLLIILIAITALNIFLSGQKKVIDKLAMAFERNDFKMFSECMSSDYKFTNEEFFNNIRSGYYTHLGTDTDENIYLKYELTSIENVPEATKEFLGCEDEFVIVYNVNQTLYDENYHIKTFGFFILQLESGKWKILKCDFFTYGKEAYILHKKLK